MKITVTMTVEVDEDRWAEQRLIPAVRARGDFHGYMKSRLMGGAPSALLSGQLEALGNARGTLTFGKVPAAE
jgi:hypothetical protein